METECLLRGRNRQCVLGLFFKVDVVKVIIVFRISTPRTVGLFRRFGGECRVHVYGESVWMKIEVRYLGTPEQANTARCRNKRRLSAVMSQDICLNSSTAASFLSHFSFLCSV